MHTLSLASTLRLIGGLALLTSASSAACSATNTINAFTTGSGGTNAGAGGSTKSGGPGSGGDEGFDAGLPPDGSIDDSGTCAAESKKAEQLPLDMYIMLDQSGSMKDSVSGGGDKWSAVTSAFKTFVTQPGAAGIGIGIQYFPLDAGGASCTLNCATDADCGALGPCLIGICFECAQSGGGSNDSCVSADYAKPDVEVATLPGAAGAFIASINAHKPTNSTPTSAALQGAIDHARLWGTMNPNHVVIDVLATDGDPTECDINLNHINAIAAAGLSGTPKVLTFVIGVGTSLSALNGTAAAGGTGQAFIVDTNQNVNQQFLDALNKIRGAAHSCTYLIPVPTKGNPDFNSVNVQYTPGDGGPVVVLPKVTGKNSCPPGGDAWFYDNNAAPKQILLCDATCTKAAADTKGQIDILLGCATIAQ